MVDAGVRLSDDDGRVEVVTDTYTWRWESSADRVELRDGHGREVFSATLAPAVLVHRGGVDVSTPGEVSAHSVVSDTVIVEYTGVNGTATVRARWRFDAAGCWLDPITYVSEADEDVVSVHWFATAGVDPRPTLRCSYLVHPGICESPVLSPIVPDIAGLDLTTWLGRGASDDDSPMQQWALPAHHFGGRHADGLPLLAGDVAGRLSDAFCLGAADLPAGDLLLRIADRAAAPVLRVRSDVWHHVRGPGELTLGPRWRLSFGPDHRAAVAAYQRAVVAAGAVELAPRSPNKAETLRCSQFCTWGAQLATGSALARLDQVSLESIHRAYRDTGMRAGLFVIDDKWEGAYGVLEHDAERLPRFEAFLDGVRAEGHRIGLWAAFLRCDDPAAVGLTDEHMLRGPDGHAIVRPGGYRLYDVTHPQVPPVLRGLVHRFMRRYRPSLVKFDFGYELPSLDAAAPHDRSAGGERMLGVALDLLVGAMREIDPDVAVMYYSLTPLLTNTVDLISTDDLFLTAGEVPAEANRRLYFSSVLTELGVPSYGSSGYDVDALEQIWFDSVASGPIGSLGPFATGRDADRLRPEQAAAFNGLARLVRPATVATVRTFGDTTHHAATGARSASWTRYEHGEPVLVALRPGGFAGVPGRSRVDGLVETDGQVVVSSLTDAPLLRSGHVGVVALGPARIRLWHDAAHGSVQALVHGLGGAEVALDDVKVVDGVIEFDVPVAQDDGTPVEHVSLHFA